MNLGQVWIIGLGSNPYSPCSASVWGLGQDPLCKVFEARRGTNCFFPTGQPRIEFRVVFGNFFLVVYFPN